MESTYSQYLSDSFDQYWNLPVYSDYPDPPITYEDVARKVSCVHRLFRNLGICPGDKVAICAKNCKNWAISYMAITTYGTVAVPLLHEFAPDTVASVVAHSDSKLLFVSNYIWNKLDKSKFKDLCGVVVLDDFLLKMALGDDSDAITESWNGKTEDTFHEEFSKQSFLESIYHYEREELVVINYTSGTTTNPKGVMIPSRALASNINFAFEVMPALKAGEEVISILPLAHTYSLSFELLSEFCKGAKVHFLTRPLHMNYVMTAFAEVKPKLLIMVPLILEKIIQKGVMPVLKKPSIKFLRCIPIVRQVINRYISKKLYKSLGGNFYEIIVGGAALSKEVDLLLHELKFPYTVGYGMTECAPIIGYEDWKRFKPGTCGKTVRAMCLMFDDSNASKESEIKVKGDNVMLGYYKNEAETRAVIDKDGWLHTGDLGTIDPEGNILIKGRCKSMILGASGQNVYPEEVEEKINRMSVVAESLVVERHGRLCALIYPDMQHSDIEILRDPDQKPAYLKNLIKSINKKLPPYQQIAEIEVVECEFEKTPKKSIKRFLYS